MVIKFKLLDNCISLQKTKRTWLISQLSFIHHIFKTINITQIHRKGINRSIYWMVKSLLRALIFDGRQKVHLSLSITYALHKISSSIHWWPKLTKYTRNHAISYALWNLWEWITTCLRLEIALCSTKSFVYIHGCFFACVKRSRCYC